MMFNITPQSCPALQHSRAADLSEATSLYVPSSFFLGGDLNLGIAASIFEMFNRIHSVYKIVMRLIILKFFYQDNGYYEN
jgi:hypothetical protein